MANSETTEQIASNRSINNYKEYLKMKKLEEYWYMLTCIYVAKNTNFYKCILLPMLFTLFHIILFTMFSISDAYNKKSTKVDTIKIPYRIYIDLFLL